MAQREETEKQKGKPESKGGRREREEAGGSGRHVEGREGRKSTRRRQSTPNAVSVLHIPHLSDTTPWVFSLLG